ncbi:MAG: hypothetical protein ACRDZM_19690, partial [Acidimicrobiia bacterium]
MPFPTTTAKAPLAPLSSARYRGVLPNGTVFDLYTEPELTEEITEASAPIIVDLEDDFSGIIDVTFADQRIDSPRWDRTTYLLPADGVSIAIHLDQDLVELIGPDYRSVVETGIRSRSVSGWPVLLLAAPFR